MEFKPSPAENRQLVRTQYMVPATLLVAFRDDAIDESVEMAALLRQVQPMGAHHCAACRCDTPCHISPPSLACILLGAS